MKPAQTAWVAKKTITRQETPIPRRDAELGQGKEHLAEARQWQTAGAGCTGVKVQAHGLSKVLNGQGKPTGSMVTIQPSR